MHKPFVFTAMMLLALSTAWAQQAVHAADGRFYFSTRYSDSNYATYKNGVLEGPYSGTIVSGERVEGELAYKKSVVNYYPAKRVIYSALHKKPDTALFELNSYKSIFLAGDTALRVLSATDDSVAEPAPSYPGIDMSFGDPAVIPRGSWHVIRVSTGKDVAIVDFDDNGNAIRLRWLDEEGVVRRDEHYPPCGKRKMIQRDALGAMQICPLEIPN
jgi:hypothetical protein